MIDYNIEVRVQGDEAVLRRNVKMSMNPFDEIAVEEQSALQAGTATEIVAVSWACSNAKKQFAQHGNGLRPGYSCKN